MMAIMLEESRRQSAGARRQTAAGVGCSGQRQRWRGRAFSTLFKIAAQIQLAFIINQSKHYPVQPAKAPQDVTVNLGVGSEEHHGIELEVSHAQRDFMAVAQESSRSCA